MPEQSYTIGYLIMGIILGFLLFYFIFQSNFEAASRATSLERENQGLRQNYNLLDSQYASLSAEKNKISAENQKNIQEYNLLVSKYNSYQKECVNSFNSLMDEAQYQIDDLANRCKVTYNILYQQCDSLSRQSTQLAYNYQSCKQQLGQYAQIDNIVNTATDVANLMITFGLI